MGNCLSEDAKKNNKTPNEPTLREVNSLQHQNNGAAPAADGVPANTQRPPHPGGQPGGHPGGQPGGHPGGQPGGHPGGHPGGQPAVGHYGYGPQAPVPGYAGGPLADYYQPRGPLLLMDPYTGTTYAYDQEAYEAYMDNERRHQRKERKKSREHDEAGNEETAKKEADRPRRHSRQQSAKTPSQPASASVTSAPKRQPKPANYQPRDVIVSYSHQDKHMMHKIKDKLEAKGVTVWVDMTSIDAGADFLSKIGEAIIDAKLFVCILSDKAVASRYCRDEVALAYVSNTAIFPVNVVPQDQLLPLMDTGLKLQLSNYKWTSLTDPSTVDNNMDVLVSTIKAELDSLRQHAEGGPLGSPPADTSEAADGGETATSPTDVTVSVQREAGSPSSDKDQPKFNKPVWLRERNRAVTSLGDDVSAVMPEQFWSNRFGSTDHVTWDRFLNAFMEEFKEPVQKTFTTEDQQQLADILKRELEVDDQNRIFKYQLIAFCSPQGQHVPVWQRVREQARESFAMREVFNMDSSVRVEAIENLGKFRSAAVIDALRDLLSDPDANVRAVATVSLSRTDANDPVTIRHILRTLSDKDRLVREAGCLALGHLKAKEAISKLCHIWRNDVISHVREAAAVALRQIGGPEVEDAMRVTKVLAEEIRTLTEMH